MKRKTSIALAVSTFGLAAAYGSPVFADSEVDELKAQLRALQQRLDQLEAKQQQAPAAAPAAAPVPANVVTAGSLPGSFKVPGSDTSLKIYGYVHLDATHDIKGRTADINNNDWAAVVFVQPFDNSANGDRRKGQTFFTARTSRFGFQTSTPTPMGEVATQVEGDFNAPNQFQGELATNSTTFRLRQAYGRVGNFLVGQTWSNFADLNSYPDTVDFNPPGSATLLRQAQLRYRIPVGAGGVALSVENPQSLSFGPGRDFDKTPDLIANYTVAQDWGHLSLRAVSHEYRNDARRERGYGLGVGGSFKFAGDTLVYNVQGGDGIGRYMFNSLLQGAIDTGTAIERWKAYGWHLGYTHNWNEAWRSNLIVSRTQFRTNNAANTAQRALGDPDLFPNRTIEQAFINTFWAFAKNTEVGLEYAYGKRKTFNDEKGTLSRINATFHYNFY